MSNSTNSPTLNPVYTAGKTTVEPRKGAIRFVLEGGFAFHSKVRGNPRKVARAAARKLRTGQWFTVRRFNGAQGSVRVNLRPSGVFEVAVAPAGESTYVALVTPVLKAAEGAARRLAAAGPVPAAKTHLPGVVSVLSRGRKITVAEKRGDRPAVTVKLGRNMSPIRVSNKDTRKVTDLVAAHGLAGALAAHFNG
ncbi:MAG: hypothetical protein ACF8TS_19060 [Maioricimonas sp. JB049]